jgi:septal ring factor EnvC (AmiA/AmiB activator)
MPTTLPPILLNSPLVDSRTLRLTSPWLHWFELSYVRQGGQEAASNTELAGGVQDNSDHIGQVEDSLGETNTTVAEVDADLKALTTRVTTLEGKVTTLEEQVETLAELVEAQSVRLTALETWREAVVASLPGVVSVTSVPTLTDAPATPDALRDNLTSAWQGPLNTNDTALQTAINAVRNALAA